MYKLLCQIFLAVTGNNLPEDAFDVLWPLLQGKRKGRESVCFGITGYSKLTPHQILLSNIPYKYYQTREQFLEFRKQMRTSKFKNRYYLDRQTIQCKPVCESGCIWVDRSYDDKIVQLNYFLYMKSENDKRVVLQNINKRREFRGVDVSWMCSCVFCGEFMRLRAYLIKNDKSNIEYMSEQINRFGFNYGESFERQQKRNISGVPICSLCKGSKERQEQYRFNMLSRGDWGQSLYHERDEQYHRNLGDMYEKPDIRQIPIDLVSGNKTPLECVLTY